MSDGNRVKLTMPSWHIPYLEKHKIMALFHELTRELVIQQPVDHLMFIKQLLYRAAKNIGLSRVIILSSPNVNSLDVARLIATQTNHLVVTEEMVLANLNLVSREKVRPSSLAMCLLYMLHTADAQNNGWILVDCVKTAAEAKKLLQAGVIPTHVLYLISPFSPNLREPLYCNIHPSWPVHRRETMNIKNVFKDKVVEIHLKQRLIHEVVAECITTLKNIKRLGCPKHLRVVILGPRGSGRNTQAKLIAQKLNLVHIDFHFILCQAWNADGEFNDSLRKAERDVCFRPDLLSEVLNRRILDEDCLSRGWILTGYPFNVADFKYMDTLDTPPNRVIFLECDLNVCKERLLNRRYNMYTNSGVNITKLTENENIHELKSHPRDSAGVIEAEITYYCEQYGAIRNYCGETGHTINADQPERWVFESILAVLVREDLSAPPRNPCLQEEDKFSSSSNLSQAIDSSTSTPPPTQILSNYVTKL
ncbi:hypothetical protein Trydic_g13243 [Trypoxylus dichotomus]